MSAFGSPAPATRFLMTLQRLRLRPERPRLLKTLTTLRRFWMLSLPSFASITDLEE